MRELFDDPSVPMLHSMVNSVVIAVVQTAGVLVLASLAGYGLARIPYRHANGVFLAILLTLMVPAAVTFVPTFVLVSTLGWVSTLRGLIVPGLFQAFAAFLFRQYFLNFPRELEEGARIDGLNYWGTFWRIVVPNSRGFFAAIATITFISTWNSFLWPLVIGQDERSWTVQIAVSTFLTSQTVNLHELSMAAVFAILPLLLVFRPAALHRAGRGTDRHQRLIRRVPNAGRFPPADCWSASCNRLRDHRMTSRPGRPEEGDLSSGGHAVVGVGFGGLAGASGAAAT